ncbi:MAG: hypothetical protein ACFFCZ_15970 [Promethearchaeota archaeon]
MNLSTVEKESFLQSKLYYLFGTSKGLISLIILFEFCIILFLSSFSEPVVKILGRSILPIFLDETERISRIIMMYHGLAIPFIAAVAIYIMELFDVRPNFYSPVKWTLVPGAFLTGVSAMIFAYILPHNMVVHGLYLVGLSLTFFSGLLLFIGLFPTKSFPDIENHSDSPYLIGINLEQFNITLVTAFMLISTIIGAIVGSFYGSGFESFLSEDIVRNEVHTLFERMIITHLHIVVALLAAAVMLITFRYTQIKGKWYLAAMILTIPGIFIMTLGAWLVIPDWPPAHMVINVGAMFLLAAALILVFYGWNKTSKSILGASYDSTSWFRRSIAVLKDPVKFGLYLQFIWVNIVVTLPGVFVALNLDLFRSTPYLLVERAFNAGHWHVLATLTAIIMLLLSADYFEVKGYIRQAIGWVLILGSIIGFGFTVVYMLRNPTVDALLFFLLIDVGVALIFAGTAAYCVFLLIRIVGEKSS